MTGEFSPARNRAQTIPALIFILCLWAVLPGFAQQGAAEEIIFADTMQIAPTVDSMVFRYYAWNDGDGYPGREKGSGRVEISFLRAAAPFESDTLVFIRPSTFGDANFDGYLDMALTTNIGASGGESVDYYFYNPRTKRFEFGIGDLSDPELREGDSTIACGAHCCMGRMGSGEIRKRLRDSNGYILIEESAYSESGSWERTLVDGALDTTSRTTVTDIGSGLLADSSWEYLIGRLRLVEVALKKAVTPALAPEELSSGMVEEDVMGAFLYSSWERFAYTANAQGEIQCAYTREIIKDHESVIAKESHWPVKD